MMDIDPTAGTVHVTHGEDRVISGKFVEWEPESGKALVLMDWDFPPVEFPGERILLVPENVRGS